MMREQIEKKLLVFGGSMQQPVFADQQVVEILTGTDLCVQRVEVIRNAAEDRVDSEHIVMGQMHSFAGEESLRLGEIERPHVDFRRDALCQTRSGLNNVIDHPGSCATRNEEFDVGIL